MTEFEPTTRWDKLIARYFEGKTSDEEEQLLRRFLASPESASPRYDDIRAVMGFFAVGRALHAYSVQPQKRRRAVLMKVAASLLLLLTVGTSWWAIDNHRNVCVAYINGQRITDREIVMQQVEQSLATVSRNHDQPSVEQQLSDMFQALDGPHTSSSELP